jgi:RNA-directed DNA polymerase
MTASSAGAPLAKSRFKTLIWEFIDWRKVYATVKKLQMRIAKAFKSGKHHKAKALQWILTHSFHAKLIAIRRVTENRGKNTPGVDGVVLKDSEAKKNVTMQLKRKGYRASPLRRIYIPKKNKKLRPLGIPTIRDRGMQALHLLALEPIAETTADKNSYGFRPKRSLHDALEQCFKALSRKTSAQWILEGDIKACFDEIGHPWLLKNTPMDTPILEQWLKSGYMDKNVFHHTESGVAQGGIISPTNANIALDGMEDIVLSQGSKKDKLHFVRYADDWICTATSKAVLEDKVLPAVIKFLQERGLSLSMEKTKIAHIRDGFDFLGANIRKYGDKLLIKPGKKGVQSFLDDIRDSIKKLKGQSASVLIKVLNPKIQGWANHYKHIVSKATFTHVDAQIFEALWKWGKRRHPNKSLRWIKEKYFTRIRQRDWIFYAHKDKDKILTLKFASDTTIERHVKIRGEATPYDPKFKEYFQNREAIKQQRRLQSRIDTNGLKEA